MNHGISYFSWPRGWQATKLSSRKNTSAENAQKIHAWGGNQTSYYMYNTWGFILEKFGIVFYIKALHNLIADQTGPH